MLVIVGHFKPSKYIQARWEPTRAETPVMLQPKSRLLAFVRNIRLGWKRLTLTSLLRLKKVL